MSRHGSIWALLLVLAGAWSLADAVRLLDRARVARAAATTVAVREPDLSASQTIRAADRSAARAALGLAVADRASAAGVRAIVGAAGLPGDPGWAVRVAVDASGGERALRIFSALLEGDRPAIRLVTWSIRPGADSVHLRGEILGAWRRGRPTSLLPGFVPAASAFLPAFAASSTEPDVRSDVPALIGIVGRVPGDVVAMLRLGTGRVVTLRTGDTADGWSVREIASDRVRIERRGRQRTIVLPTIAAADQ